jgi:hypothetical protein
MRFVVPFVFLFSACATPRVVTPGFDVRPVDGLGFFNDERAKSRELISAELRRRGVPLVDQPSLDRALALAAEGRHPLTGAVCGQALDHSAAVRRWADALHVTGVANTSVWCPQDKPCELHVYSSSLAPGVTGVQLKTVLEADGPALVALEKALPTLALPPKADGGGLLGGLGSRNAPVQVDDLLVTRAWLADQRDRRSDREVKDAFPQLTVAAVSNCLAPNEVAASLLAEFDATGRLSRCEDGGHEERPVTVCLCGRLEGLGPQSALAGSRWSTSFHIDRRDKLNRDGRLVLSASWNTWTRPKVIPGEKFPRFEERVEDLSLRGWRPGSSRLVAGCFEGRTEPGRVSSRWAVWFDEQGRATKVAEQKGWPPLEVDVAKCVSRLLMTAQAPCPARGNLWAMADLHVTLRDPNAPPETPAMTP